MSGCASTNPRHAPARGLGARRSEVCANEVEVIAGLRDVRPADGCVFPSRQAPAVCTASQRIARQFRARRSSLRHWERADTWAEVYRRWCPRAESRGQVALGRRRIASTWKAGNFEQRRRCAQHVHGSRFQDRYDQKGRLQREIRCQCRLCRRHFGEPTDCNGSGLPIQAVGEQTLVRLRAPEAPATSVAPPIPDVGRGGQQTTG